MDYNPIRSQIRKLAVVPLALLVLLLSPAATSRDRTIRNTWESDLQRAKQAYDKKDYRSYREALLQFHREFPDNSRLLQDLALSEARLHHEAEALKWLHRYVERGLVPRLEDPDLSELRAKGKLEGICQEARKNSLPVAKSTTLFRLEDSDLLVEDIAYDPESRRFFLSSVHQRKIITCTASGQCEDFLPPDDAVAGTLWGVLALHIDSHRRVLWATTSSMRAEARHQKADEGKSALLKFDLRSRRLIKRYEPQGGKEHAMGDMTVSSNGDVFVSDGLSGDVFVVFQGRDILDNLVPEGTFISPQTPALTEDENSLFVPDYSAGIALVRLSDRKVDWVRSRIPVALQGIDGLYYRERTLFAVQNGTQPERVMAFHLDTHRGIDSSQVLETNSPVLGDPTHGIFVGSDFYFIANSGWDRMQDDGTLRSGTPAEIRKIALPAPVKK